MRIRLLGTAAGGGFPQWNCNCACCRTARIDPSRARPRMQSSVAISADDRTWFLLNASPDVRQQIESFPPLRPPEGQTRGTSIAGVILTDADLDHTLGLFVLREGPAPLTVYATASVREALSDHLNLTRVLANYAGVEWRQPPTELTELRGDLQFAAFAVAGTPPRYARSLDAPRAAVVVGYRFVDARSGGRLLYVPHLPAIDDDMLRQLRDCDLLLIDGTCWSNDELRSAEVSPTTALEMGHLPVGGDGGSLRQIAALPIARKVYVHLNNTNPMLLEDSPQRREVEAAGVAIGCDGMELCL